MDIERINYLYTQYQNGNLTLAEQQELLALINKPEFENQFQTIFDNNWTNLRADEILYMSAQTQKKQVDHITSLPRNTTPTFKLWQRIGVAAAIVTVIFGASLFYYSKNNTVTVPANAYLNDIAPGKVGATLTLANGKKIRLSDAANGEIAKEAGIVVRKNEEGQLIYELKASSGLVANQGGINTLSTARGETYLLILPDQSKVWLNAASSLTYAANLLDKGVRRIKLQGEAYFEIFKDKAHPFVVSTTGQDVEVLGTHFNINSYQNEPLVKTTLLEGRVKVLSANGDEAVLKPNQQAVFNGKRINVSPINGDDAIAWKKGLFVFEDEPLESILRKVERWYDVDIEYAAGVNRKELYYGSVSRYDKVSKVLEALKSTGGLHFEIQGRRILVKK